MDDFKGARNNASATDRQRGPQIGFPPNWISQNNYLLYVQDSLQAVEKSLLSW